MANFSIKFFYKFFGIFFKIESPIFNARYKVQEAENNFSQINPLLISNQMTMKKVIFYILDFVAAIKNGSVKKLISS